LLASNLFAYFASEKAPILFPGAAFFMAAILVLIGWFIVMRSIPKKAQ
jgi:DHA1 family tetracycline resistance protein-like MFS transporter